jgi:hypothetical protein
MSTTTATSAPPEWRRRPRVAEPGPGSTGIGSVTVERRRERARRRSDAPVAPRRAARPSRHGWQRSGAVIGGVVAAVFLGTLSS